MREQKNKIPISACNTNFHLQAPHKSGNEQRDRENVNAMNKGQDVRIDLFKSNGDPKESSKQGRRCARVSIFGCYKVHFWDERHGLLPFPSSLGVSSVILLAINYAVFSPSSSGLSSFVSLSLFLYLLSSLQNLPRPEYLSKRSRTTYRRKFSRECRVS